MNDSNSIGVLVLAAGGSSRLGQPKQLVRLGGKTLLQRTIEAVANSGLHQIVIVLGANAETILPTLKDFPVEICLNPDWTHGMSTSIRKGIEKVEESYPTITGVLIFLADQPFVSHQIIAQLLKTFLHSGNGIIASKYGETIGVPAIFPKLYFPDLKNLEGDKGAGKLLIRYSEFVKTVAFHKGNIDIDTPADLENIQKRFSESKGDLPDFD